jgi:SAM-dependent methyltransferase
MTDSTRFLEVARSDVHSVRPWSQWAYANRALSSMVRDLLDAADLQPGQRLLDYGCADRPYRSLVPAGVDYVGADLPGNFDADLELRLDGTVPLPDRSVDVILSTQVLEHVPQPNEYLAECFRLLRPGGTLVISTHGLMYYHRDPEDYWRWTPAGIRKVLGDQCLDIMELRGLLGLAAAALQVFQDATYWFVPRLLRRPYTLLMQGLIALADKRYSDDLRNENSWVIAVRAIRHE